MIPQAIPEKFNYRVVFAGESTGDYDVPGWLTTNLPTWNTYCETASEMFGKPGDKFTLRIVNSGIEFWFVEEKDALLFELCCG